MIKSSGKAVRSAVNKLINYVSSKDDLAEYWKGPFILPIFKKGNKTDCSNYRRTSLLSTTHRILFISILSRLTPISKKIIGDQQCEFRCKGYHMIIHYAFVKQLRNNGNTTRQCISYLYVDFKKTCDSVRREMYNILIEIGVSMKLVMLTKM